MITDKKIREIRDRNSIRISFNETRLDLYQICRDAYSEGQAFNSRQRVIDLLMELAKYRLMSKDEIEEMTILKKINQA